MSCSVTVSVKGFELLEERRLRSYKVLLEVIGPAVG